MEKSVITLFVIFCSIVLDSSLYAEADDAGRPNILLIVADDLGFSDLGCYGGEIETPNLDRLASRGVRLSRFYNLGRCCPSRTSLLTGQYPHRVGVGHKVADLGEDHPGYRGKISTDAKTIAEVIAPTGYQSFISGKWHLGTPDPTRHGFEKFYGTLVSAKTFWDADHFFSIPKDEKSALLPSTEKRFYATDATTDAATSFLEQARRTPNRPWFLYLAYHAPHFPLHARQEDIEKYVDTYKVGWDQIREQRLERMKSLGIVPDATQLSPRSEYWNFGETETGTNPAWASLPADRQDDLARRMAIYAAMVDRVDQNVGRLLENLESHRELENTLIVFLSDNGACGEWDPFGFDISSSNQNILHAGKKLDAMGGPGTYHSVGSGWANASNTPWRLQKHFNHEGGINSPCIVHWPEGKLPSGTINHAPTHVIDILPTIAAAAGVTTGPEVRGGFVKTLPMPGENLLPLLIGSDDLIEEKVASRPLFFEHEGNRAVHLADWKLVALRNQPWELYATSVDRTEMSNLAGDHPDIVNTLSLLWDEWASENFVTPLPKDYGVEYLRGDGKGNNDDEQWTYRDRYSSLEQPSRRAARGEWQFDDRVARCTHHHEGPREKSGVHGPVIWYDLDFQDAEIRFAMKPDDDVMSFQFTINGEDGHVFRMTMKSSSTDIRAFPHDDEPKAKLAEGPSLLPNKWTDVSVKIEGDKAQLRFGSLTQTVSHPALKRAKTTIGLGINYGTIELRGFRLRTLETHADETGVSSREDIE